MRAGEVIADRFSIERLTATGGMGKVYRAVDLHTDRVAALKIVHPADAHAVERFAREARVLADLRHPGIVDYLAHGRTSDGLLYLAMEWLEGEDLGKRLATHELDLSESLEIVTQAAVALAVAHARHIVHRDVKPSNLFLCDWQPGRLKLLDFGVARLGRMTQLTSTGVTVGTPLYMAPEQARGERRVDARADVFALGLVLFRCLTGRHAHGAGHTNGEIFAWLLSEEPAPRVRSLAPGVPEALDDLCARMLAKDPEARPADGAAVLAESIGLDATQSAGARPTAGRLGAEERRVECMVVVDSGRSDELAALAAAHGASLEPTATGSALVFAGPGLATDRAQQAARCALALRAALPRAALGLAVRRGHHTPSPPALGTAGSIRVDPDAAGLLSARFALAGESGALLLVGEQGLERPSGRASEFVGRERELALLDGALAGCVDDGAASVVLVTAPAGTGKSRLIKEWLARLQDGGTDVEVWAGFGDPMRAGAPFGLLGEAVRRAAGIRGDEPLETRRALLAARVQRHLGSERGQQVTELLGELAGVPFDAEGSPRLRAARRDALLLADQMRAAWSELLAAETGRRPLVLVLEDLHWGDVATVKLVDDALQALAERPLLVLGLARPEVAELFPRLWEGRGVSQIHLAALPRKACERLVRAALGAAAPVDEVAAIVDRGQGNAFFLEELARHVAERSDRSLPDSILAMVGARFEALPAEVRRVLRAASVFGEVFWTTGVAALLGADAQAVEPALVDLVERDVLTRRRGSRFGDSDELAFRHSLLREAAYALLTDEDRALGHRLAGAWLSAAGEQESLLLAEHFERAGRPADAVDHYRRAAEQSLAAMDPDGAVARAERGVTCGAAGEALGTLRLVQARAHRALGHAQRTREAGRESMSLLAAGSEPWFAVAGETAGATGKLNLAAELEELVDVMERACPPREALSAVHAVALARGAAQAYLLVRYDLGDRLMAPLLPTPPRQLAGEPEVLGWFEEVLSYRSARSVAIVDSIEHIAAAARHYAAAGDIRSSLMAELEVMSYEGELGLSDYGLERVRKLIPETERLRLPAATRLARVYLVMGLVAGGRIDEALTEARAAAEGIVAGANPRVAAAAAWAMATALDAAGRLDDAEAELRRGLEVGPGGMPFVFALVRDLGMLLARRGRAAEALPLVERTLALLVASPMAAVFYQPHLLACRAASLAAVGRDDEARSEARRALEGLDASAAALPPELRRGYLEDHIHNRRLREIVRPLGV